MKHKLILLVFTLIVIKSGITEDYNNIIDINKTAIAITNQYPDYPATPGDIYEINFVVSDTKHEIKAFVDSKYKIDLSFIGTVNVKGLKYFEVQDILKKEIIKSYPGSIVNVLITVPGRFKITLLGEVKQAHHLDILSLTTLSQVVSGKLTNYASLRDIEIKSDDGSLNIYDLFHFYRYADITNNPYLRPNDIITIKPYNRYITIEGEVKRPGKYQLLASDTLHEVVNLYGDGFTKFAKLSKIEIKRLVNENDDFSHETLYIDGNNEDLSNIKINDRDVVTIHNKMKFMPKVFIQGAITSEASEIGSEINIGVNVSNKVPVRINSGTKVSTVINSMSASFNLSSDLEKSYILRGDDKIDINLKKVLEGKNINEDIVMKDNDILVIPFRQLVVYVAGSVNQSKAIPFIENRTAEYYIGAAGGLNRKENLFGTYFVRNVYGEKVNKKAIISPEDVIWVNRDNPFSYITEYAGHITTVLSVIILSYQLDRYINALDTSSESSN